MKTANKVCFPGPIKTLLNRWLPEEATPVGYAALIQTFDLKVPVPVTLSAISARHRKYMRDSWRILTPRHMPQPTLRGHLTFALKYEGVDLALLKRLFLKIGPVPLQQMVSETPASSFARRLWFLYEWLLDEQLNLHDSESKGGAYVPVVDPALQYSVPGETSRRHRVRNNLPGTREFCPLVFRTELLERYYRADLPARAREVIGEIPVDILSRAAAFLLLDDSRASFEIEEERAPQNRIQRWGQAIGESGRMPLSRDELLRLQQILIGDFRFMRKGLREEGGFVGQHERRSGKPLPVHISAPPEYLDSLMDGLISFDQEFAPELDPVVAASVLSFGFVYIHPFEDGNGRIHRLLMHHELTRRGFNPPELPFPVSSAILGRIQDYRSTLESYSTRLLPMINWEPTSKGNVKVLNDTADFYRYFDATAQSEFLYMCVEQTIDTILPQEVTFLEHYDRFQKGMSEIVEMPSRKIDLLRRFLHQNGGRLSSRAMTEEFAALSEEEAEEIESLYKSCF